MRTISAVLVTASLAALPVRLLAQAPTAAATPPRPIAFVDVTVVPLDHEGELTHQTVIVRDGTIMSVTSAASADIPNDATRIDGRGKWLMPGLADMHVHLFSRTDLGLYLANGVTTIRNLGGYGFADSILTARAAIASGDLVGPTIFTSGNWLDGDPPVRSINTVISTPAEGKAEVDREADAGYDFIKVYSRLAADVYAAIIAEANARHIPVTGHIPFAVGLAGVLTSGQTEIAHAGGIYRSTGGDSSKFAAAAHRVADAGVAVATTVSEAALAYHLSGRPDAIAARAALPEMRYIPPGRVAAWRDHNMFASFTRVPNPDAQSAGLARFIRALGDAGVTLLAGTDADVAGQLPGYSLHDELGDFVAGGLSPYEALRLATVVPYRYLARVLKKPVEPFGTVQPGRRADLLLLEGDPLTDLANTKRMVGVMVRGRWLTATALRNRIDAVARTYAHGDTGD